MDAGTREPHSLQEAWHRFASGDLDSALALARELRALAAATPQAHAALGFFLLQANEIDEAAGVLLPARERFPGYAPLHWYAGYLYQRRGNTPAAAEAFEQACELDETLDEAACALAWALHDLGRTEEAARWAAHALACRKTPQRLMQMGWMCQQLELFAQGVNAYREAIETFDAGAPEQPRLRLHVSQCLRRIGLEKEAEGALADALEHWPKDAEVLAEAAWHRRSAGDLHGALRGARDLVREHPDRAGAWHLLGVVQQELGELEAADEALRQAQERDVSLVDALLRRARIQRSWQRFDGARWLLGLALSQAPANEAARDLLAQVFLDLGETDNARRLLIESLRSRPRSSDLRRLLAIAQSRRGRPAIARTTLRRALELDPGNVEALRTRAWWALEQGHTAEAVDVVQQLLARVPQDSAAHVQAAFVLAHAGNLGAAQTWAERAVARDPQLAEAWRALSVVRLAQGRLGQAEAAVRQALRIAPADHDCLRQWGWVLVGSARHGQAQLAFLRALESRPGDAVCRLELAQARLRAGHFETAQTGVDALLDERPNWRPALLLDARLKTEAGLPGAAQACMRVPGHATDALKVSLRLAGLGHADARRLLPTVPLDALRDGWRAAIADGVHAHGHDYLSRVVRGARADIDEDFWIETAALYVASLSADVDAPHLARQARDWYRGLKVRSGLTRLPAPKLQDGGGPVRIAYVAGQLHQSLLRRALAAHSASDVQIHLYTNQSYAGLPRNVHVQPLELDTLAESCAANGIDVLIDTGGLHPFEGQFGLLQLYARRIAPVQVGWLGCWGTAGGLFDALLTDEAAVPQRHAAYYEEAMLRIDGGQWCWDPPPAAPDPAPSPARSHGSVTYGVTARSLKLGGACLDAFARVVAQTPGSSIRFIGAVADDWPLRCDILARMQAQGVIEGRVFFDPFLPYAGYLEWFRRVDIVLDSFPGNGGLSVLDPLWMGVPVVSLAGQWAGARQGASVLASLGLQAWIADSQQAFCAGAVALASDMPQLARHRSTLRARIAASPLVDGRRVASQIESFCVRLRAASANQVAAQDAKARTRAHAQWSLDAWLASPRVIDLPTVEAGAVPDLSVVIVLYNQAGLSRRTLQALADQRDVRFETIVVDNASSDRTVELLAQLRGARVICNRGNQGFLLAARQGAAAATGRHLAFLNSDAILQDGALRAAVEAIDADSSIGALGGRIVLTDGGLQEAGNGVFRDGRTLGIGRGEDPLGHAARAERSTDYVSGVFLVTPMAVWRELGGFDPAFAPAYYEDADYCLRVWNSGRRVVYAPSVLLEHLEWGSATGDSATVLMERNRELFRSRHAQWLAQQKAPHLLPLDGDIWNSPDDRPRRRPRVLFVENEVPHMSKGGGLPRTRVMLRALRGWPVTMFPLWSKWDDWRAIYTSLPRTVEVALGHGLEGLERFLERRRGVYDVLMVSRPPNLDALRPLRSRRPELFAGMRLVYDAEALFALREIAMAGVLGPPLPRAQARERLQTEIALADGASDVMVVSERDARHFTAAGLRTHILSHGIAVRRQAPGLAGRGGLLFVGALHPGTPNEDGLLWFVREVMPLLAGRAGGVPLLSVVGVCASPQIAALAGPSVKILGPQEALEPHYDAARVFVAPARFAGGVPVKVIEAVASGIPAVASALLVRQLGWRDGIDILGARDARAFADGIARLLDDDAAWVRQQSAGWDQCAARYDPEVFGRMLRDVLDAPPAS